MIKMHTNLFTGTFLKTIFELRRYVFDTISNMISLYIVFIFLFINLKYQGNLKSSSMLVDSLIMNYTLWMFIVYGYNCIASNIISSTQKGILQQLYMAPMGIQWYFFYDAISYFFISFIEIGIVFLLIVFTTGYFNLLSCTLIMIMPILFIAIFSIWGIGYMLGGLSLLFKKISSFSRIIQYIFIGLLVLPLGKYPIMKFLPFSYGAFMINQIINKQCTLQSFAAVQYLILFLNSAFYFVIGIIIYKLCETKVIQNGSIDHY